MGPGCQVELEGRAEHPEREWQVDALQQGRRPWHCPGQGIIPVRGISGFVSNLYMLARRAFQSLLDNCSFKHAEWVMPIMETRWRTSTNSLPCLTSLVASENLEWCQLPVQQLPVLTSGAKQMWLRVVIGAKQVKLVKQNTLQKGRNGLSRESSPGSWEFSFLSSWVGGSHPSPLWIDNSVVVELLSCVYPAFPSFVSEP